MFRSAASRRRASTASARNWRNPAAERSCVAPDAQRVATLATLFVIVAPAAAITYWRGPEARRETSDGPSHLLLRRRAHLRQSGAGSGRRRAAAAACADDREARDLHARARLGAARADV